MRKLVSSGFGNAKDGSNISFPPYLQLAPRRWGTARTELGSSHSSWKGSRLLSTPAMAACFDEVVARAVRVSQPAVLSALLAIQLFGFVSPPTNFSKEHQKERCGHFRSQRSFITFYGALRNILLSAGFPAMFHMIALEQTFVNGPLQKISLADTSESNRFYPCFRESRDVVSADIPVC